MFNMLAWKNFIAYFTITLMGDRSPACPARCSRRRWRRPVRL